MSNQQVKKIFKKLKQMFKEDTDAIDAINLLIEKLKAVSLDEDSKEEN